MNNKDRLIKDLAEEFQKEFKKLSIQVLPNKDIVYNEFLIKKSDGNWVLIDITSKDIIASFFLKSCALLAAQYYKDYLFNEYRKIKQLDRDYKRNYLDSIIHRHNLSVTKDFDTKVILLNQIECEEANSIYFKKQISTLFKRSFV